MTGGGGVILSKCLVPLGILENQFVGFFYENGENDMCANVSWESAIKIRRMTARNALKPNNAGHQSRLCLQQ